MFWFLEHLPDVSHQQNNNLLAWEEFAYLQILGFLYSFFLFLADGWNFLKSTELYLLMKPVRILKRSTYF